MNISTLNNLDLNEATNNLAHLDAEVTKATSMFDALEPQKIGLGVDATIGKGFEEALGKLLSLFILYHDRKN